MEIANDDGQLLDKLDQVRVAKREDASGITTLLQNAPHTHIHADWHYPVDWLGSPGFVVVDEADNRERLGSMSARFFVQQPRIRACLAVAADPPPAAWVRVAALGESIDAQQALAVMFDEVHEYLRETAVTQLGWLLVESWPNSWIRELGFEQSNRVGTFVKHGTDVPAIQSIPGLQFRPVSTNDLKHLEEIDTNAFQPLWRNSRVGLTLARRQAFSFDVAEYNNEVVGYQCSTMLRDRAHLSRIAVEPSVQGSGVGSALLAYALEGYRRRGVKIVSLNTQLDNTVSQRVYRRFGFKPEGQQFPVWTIQYERA